MFKIRGRGEATIKECASNENVPAKNDFMFPAKNDVTTNKLTVPASNDVMFPAGAVTPNTLRAVASSFHVASADNPRKLSLFRSFRKSEGEKELQKELVFSRKGAASVENVSNRKNGLLQSIRMRHKT